MLLTTLLASDGSRSARDVYRSPRQPRDRAPARQKGAIGGKAFSYGTWSRCALRSALCSGMARSARSADAADALDARAAAARQNSPWEQLGTALRCRSARLRTPAAIRPAREPESRRRPERVNPCRCGRAHGCRVMMGTEDPVPVPPAAAENAALVPVPGAQRVCQRSSANGAAATRRGSTCPDERIGER